MIYRKSFIIFSLLLIRTLLNAQVEECAGIITGINGNVHVRKVQSEYLSKAYWGFQLFNGDQVITSDGSDAIITFSNNTVMKLGSGSTITLNSRKNSAENGKSNIKKISSASLINLGALTTQKNKAQESGALAGLRASGTKRSVIPVSPYNTLIRTIRPTLAWASEKEFGGYIVSLYNNNGLIWKKKVNGTSLSFPEDEPELIPGQSYFWNIEAEGFTENERSDNFKFSIVTKEKAEQIDFQESEIKNSLNEKDENCSLHSVLGVFYINQGLINEAIGEFEIISGINPDSAVPHEILGSLYNELGNKDRAIEELKTALSLSRKDDK